MRFMCARECRLEDSRDHVVCCEGSRRDEYQRDDKEKKKLEEEEFKL
jgi:hypothetical protein